MPTHPNKETNDRQLGEPMGFIGITTGRLLRGEEMTQR